MNPYDFKVKHNRDVVFIENEFLGKETKKKATENFMHTVSEELVNDDEENGDDDFHDSSEQPDQTEEESGSQFQNVPIRKSTRKWKPITKEGFVSYSAVEDSEENPMSLEDALENSAKEKWIEAINSEFASLEKNNSWEIVERPKNVKVLGTRWVFKTKRIETGELKYKARLVIQGHSQIQGVDYEETFSPVARYSSIRYLLSYAAQQDLKLTHLDVETAYLNGKLNENIFINPPELFQTGVEKGKILKLKKAIYGLKQSGRVWNEKLDSTLRNLRFERSNADPCIYIKRDKRDIMIIIVYVDDLLILWNDKKNEEEMKRKLQECFAMRDLGEAREFLGIEITRNLREKEIALHQGQYIKRMLERFNMSDCKPVKTPMDPNGKITRNAKDEIEDINEQKEFPYMEAVGSLLYLSQISRPDISFAVNVVSSFCRNPQKCHWLAVKRIMRYIKGTSNLKLLFKGSYDKSVIGFSDADWANDAADRKSITGCVFMSSGGPVSWSSKKQKTVALSTVEAEYIALSYTCQEAIWLRQLMRDDDPEFEEKAIRIKCDNNGAIYTSKARITSPRTKHIDVRHHFIRQNVENKIVNIEYLETSEMPADILTKPLNAPKHKYFIDKLGMKD